MIVDNNIYTELGNALVKWNGKKNHHYIYPQNVKGTSPLDSVVPLYSEFFGPKVLSIVVLSKNYGWESGSLNWPDNTIEQQKQTIKDTFLNWVKYKVYFYVDHVLANRIMAATPSSDYLTQMATVEDKVHQICMEMGDYGFEYKGVLEEAPPASLFQNLIKEFWSTEGPI